MDFSATQVYEDEDNLFTDSHALTEEESVQVGTLSINSTDYQIKTGITKIGRLDICNIVIRNETVSKLHAEIEASGRGSTWICDLKSLNKTKLNNLILRPNRSYELKDGSVIEFGGVRATYHINCPANDEVIPETPAPSRQKTANIIIPNTPDSSLNNSSSVDNDGSIIFGTQKDDETRNVFRRPRVPQQSPSPSINKKNTSKNESNDSLSIALHTSDIIVSENQVSIYEAETQKFDEGCKTTLNSIYDMETQGDLIDISKHVKTNAKNGKQLPKLNICDKTAGKSVTDIHDIEIQNCLDNINEMEKDNISIRNVTAKKFTTDIHTMETQADTDNIDEDSSDAQNSEHEIDKGNSQEKNLAKIGRSIHDLETQKFDDNYIAKNISDLETQLENSIARGEQNKNISDMETQFETDGMANEISNDRANKEKDRNDIASTTKDGINHEDIIKSPRSRSRNHKYLNLSSPRVEGKLPSSLNQSAYLLESSGLLEIFSEGIDEQEVQASNASTPKSLAKVSLKKNSNVEHVQNMINDEENDEDIFEAPTQCVSHKFEALMSDDSETDEKDAVIMSKDSKKKCGKPRSEQTNDVSETDIQENIAELAEKERKLRTLNKPSDEVINDRNDPGTSIESEDLFDVQTQLNNPVTNNTSNSSIDQSQNSNKINEAKFSDMPTQIINNNDNQRSTSVPDIDDVAPTQVILSRETSPSNSIDLTPKNNRSNANKRIINTESVDYRTTENLDCEDIDYELAPTQVIGEIENKGKGISTREKGSSQVNLNDTLEEKLNEMFDDVNNDMNSIHESPHMSTQYLEKILESSQSDDSINKANDDDGDTCNVPQKQIEKKQHASRDQRSHNLLDSEVNTNNVNKAETESQNSDIYFSTITTKRKRNILKDTQEFPDSVKDITPDQDTDFSRTSKASNEKAMDDNVESNKRKKRIAKTKHKSDSITKTLNDNDKNKIISRKNNKRSLRSSKLMKYDDEPASKTRKQVLESDQTKLKVDAAEEKTSICIPCPSENDGQRAQILDTSYESDDDILTRLPAVRISGTLSNPASPSASSTSTVCSTKSKRNTARSKRKESTSLKGKSLRKQDIENSGKHNKSSIDSQSNLVHDNLMTDKIAGLVDISDESDDSSESTYKRFQQIADRILSNKHNYPKRQKKRNKESSRVSPNMSEDPKQNTDDESKNSWISTRITRQSSKQNDKSPHDLQKETLKSIEATNYETTRSTESETKSIIGKRKTPLNVVEKNKDVIEQTTSKKRKTVAEECPVSIRSRRNAVKTIDRQSPNILEHVAKIRSHESISENIKSSEDNKAISKITLEETQEISLNMRTDGNVYPERSNVKRIKQTIYDNQVMTHVNDVTASENSKKNKPTKKTEIQTNQQLSKVPKIILSPLKSLKNLSDDGSQEIESIMAKAPSNTRNKNLSIREGSKTKIFKRELRTRSKKQQNSDTETDSVLTESSLSSEIEDSDNTQLDNVVPKTRKRSAKSSISSLSQVSIKRKEEIFKKPSRIKNFTSSLIDTSTENITGESSQSGTESDTSRSSRSRTARKKMESNQNTRRLTDESASSLNTSTETTSLILTPSRTRRSMSILNNSISSAMKHKVLFTGITGVMENYSEIVKTLGGSKVEDPAQCTVLVTDKVRRTYKFLCALAKSVPIVAIDWLTESKTKKEFIDWEKHILKDPEAETRYDFKLRESLDKAREKKMLDGYIVVLTPNVGPPPIKELKDIVSSCGGKTLLRPPTKWPERAMILSRKEDLPNAKKFLAKAPKTVTVQDIEFILTGILRQETDFVKYKLTH
ncbi:PREDICTED: MATH and LRR domain-containing protein PFE0570w [Acromyrmex echinatior]|uniref:Mediator of DNA damage checkpoint protein 1 n=1 Tax=Acromyrmex echinatior TaxID=103372 RepID=F4X7W4_ACREC|nr:PREDICTED: MATH and LRR domain-containing protein PFE0570w [Acromyrmex echinatior]EGI57450.1 Mediator of DNA damage checkpoint protein 1 [Acromyrmex echinatior]